MAKKKKAEESVKQDELILECPNCQHTYPASKWNENVKNSISLGRAEELIPIHMTTDEWENYSIDKSFGVDCPNPECGDYCASEDINAV